LPGTGDPTLLNVEDMPILRNTLFLKEWLHDELLQISPGDPSRRPDVIFINDLMLVCFLAFTLYYEPARMWLCHAPAADAIGRHGSLFQYSRDQFGRQWKRYSIHDFVNYLVTVNENYLWHGLWFLEWVNSLPDTRLLNFIRHMFANDFVLDLHMATCFIEDLVARLLIQETRHKKTGFHGLLIPRSWFVQSSNRIWTSTLVFTLAGFKQKLINMIASFMYNLHRGHDSFLGQSPSNH
jgi:hypothetical protein